MGIDIDIQHFLGYEKNKLKVKVFLLITSTCAMKSIGKLLFDVQRKKEKISTNDIIGKDSRTK